MVVGRKSAAYSAIHQRTNQRRGPAARVPEAAWPPPAPARIRDLAKVVGPADLQRLFTPCPAVGPRFGQPQRPSHAQPPAGDDPAGHIVSLPILRFSGSPALCVLRRLAEVGQIPGTA